MRCTGRIVVASLLWAASAAVANAECEGSTITASGVVGDVRLKGNGDWEFRTNIQVQGCRLYMVIGDYVPRPPACVQGRQFTATGALLVTNKARTAWGLVADRITCR